MKKYILKYILLSAIILLISLIVLAPLIDKKEINKYNHDNYKNIISTPNMSAFYVKGQSTYEGSFDEKHDLKLNELPLGPIFSGRAEFGLLPLVISDEFILSASTNRITLYSIPDEFITVDFQESIIVSVSFPFREDEKICVYFIKLIKQNKPHYILKKLEVKDYEFEVKEIACFDLEKNKRINTGATLLSYFKFDNHKNAAYLPIKETDKEYIAKYDLENETFVFYDEGSIIIPNKESLFYLCINDIKTEDRLCSCYKLKNEKQEICTIDKPILQAYFIDDETLFLNVNDTNIVERFDLINGPWSPVPKTMLFNTKAKSFIEINFIYKWRKFLFQNMVRNEYIMALPKLQIS